MKIIMRTGLLALTISLLAACVGGGASNTMEYGSNYASVISGSKSAILMQTGFRGVGPSGDVVEQPYRNVIFKIKEPVLVDEAGIRVEKSAFQVIGPSIYYYDYGKPIIIEPGTYRMIMFLPDDVELVKHTPEVSKLPEQGFATFTIKPGEALYLGEFFSDYSYGEGESQVSFSVRGNMEETLKQLEGDVPADFLKLFKKGELQLNFETYSFKHWTLKR